jgi:hypothetical protein
MDDADLAAVLDTYETEIPSRKQRQFLFANAMYTNAVLAYRLGNVSWEGLHGHLRLICQNEIFRQYWEATRHHRASLEASSDEARVGRMVDQLILDLEDAEEWWVAGTPHDRSGAGQGGPDQGGTDQGGTDQGGTGQGGTGQGDAGQPDSHPFEEGS